MQRREFILSSLSVFTTVNLPAKAFASAPDLNPPDEHGVRLPSGYRSRIVARSGEPPVASSDYSWHFAPDGGACFSLPDNGWVYVSNSEMPRGEGGAGALRFNAQGELVDAYALLNNTSLNCAGGATPWQTWLSCEEHDRGQVWECSPEQAFKPVARPAMGVLKHEAVAVDPVAKQLYLTEDVPDGCLYRFTPANYPELSKGVLEVASGTHEKLNWLVVSDPMAKQKPLRYQHENVLRFNGGEGIVYRDGEIFFSTKGDDRIWFYSTNNKTITVHYDAGRYENPVLTGVDNLAFQTDGSLLVAEDGGDMQIVVVKANGQVYPLLQLVGHDDSEITGIALSPDATRLYFSSQRGSLGHSAEGVTYEITGPF